MFIQVKLVLKIIFDIKIIKFEPKNNKILFISYLN